MRNILGLCFCVIFLIAVSIPTVLLAAPDQDCSDSDQASPSLIESINNNKDVWKLEGCNTVRHIQSNTLCEPSIGDWPLDRLIIFPSDPAIARGNDIGCDYIIPHGGGLTLYITHLDKPRSEEEAFNEFTAAILSRFPNARPVQVIRLENETIKPHAALYEIELKGEQHLTGVWYQTIRGWDVKVRATFPANPQVKAEGDQFESSLLWFSKAMALDKVESE